MLPVFVAEGIVALVRARAVLMFQVLVAEDVQRKNVAAFWTVETSLEIS
jgi:hypothetical protein